MPDVMGVFAFFSLASGHTLHTVTVSEVERTRLSKRFSQRMPVGPTNKSKVNSFVVSPSANAFTMSIGLIFQTSSGLGERFRLQQHDLCPAL